MGMDVMAVNSALLHRHRLLQEALGGAKAPEQAATVAPAPEVPGVEVRAILRAEGAAVFAAGVAAFAVLGAPWWLFAALFLVPDLAMAGYLRDARRGAAVYNAAHSYVAPAALAAVALGFAPWLLPAAAVWAAHIGLDRALGFGLKFRDGFGSTHLGRIGR